MGTQRRRSWWGWGYEDEAFTPEQVEAMAPAVARRLGADVEARRPPELGDVDLRPSRVEPPPALAGICSAAPFDRAGHTYGKSFRDVVRGFSAELPHPPDLVAYPASEEDVAAVLDWCAGANVAAIPYGAGSSVVGGVEADVGDGYAGAISVDLGRLDRVLEVDRTSRAARIQAGALGPVLEGQLRPHGLTLRHFPQSFELSTLGGWIATRSGGHYASLYTHVDDFVESLRVVTPAGLVETRRLPGSGAGPAPDRLFVGSEGALGVITEAWVRVQDRPRWKASAGVRFGSLAAGAEGARAVAQAGLFPSNCRLLDSGEAAAAAGVADGTALLVLGFESADHPVDAWMARALECCADHGGTVPEGERSAGAPGSGGPPGDEAAAGGNDGGGGGAAGAWRSSFLRAPYQRDALVALGCVSETFETACTWDRFPALHAAVAAAVETALAETTGGGTLTCRFTHVYPDGPAPYFTVLAPSRHGSQLAHWNEIKVAASEALAAAGGTITHHHAVGRDHRPWYDRERPDLFGAALRAAKARFDPAGVLNPGVLVDPAPA